MTEVNKGKKKMVKTKCPHCRGYTKCSCADCGQMDNRGRWMEGICKVCKGLGYIIEEEKK